MAGRGTDIKLSREVSENGGLHVILTEFHESARVDRQLFGRCARQGEPGTVEAVISLEDDLLVRHAAALKNIVTKIAVKRGRIPGWMLKVLVRFAQWVAESHNARVRMATLKQDRKLQRLLGFSGTPD